LAFNNAGVEEEPSALDTKSAELYDKVFNINVKGLFLSLKHEIQAMLKNTSGGAIVNTSSIAGHVGMGTIPIYIASKHAVEGFTKSIALEYAPQKIRVNAVAPAAIETPMVDRFTGGNADFIKMLEQKHPIGRVMAFK
jgi:NAD(P)-dependent dehydrogenase (short-subunit alcohol dehydrogenase family)